MQYPLDEDELAVLDDGTIRVFSYHDRDEGQRKYPNDPLEFQPGETLLLPHVNAEARFRYLGTVARDCYLGEETPHFRFDCPESDFPIAELILDPNQFMREVGDRIWYF